MKWDYEAYDNPKEEPTMTDSDTNIVKDLDAIDEILEEEEEEEEETE